MAVKTLNTTQDKKSLKQHVPSQNNLTEVIRSQVENINSVINVIIDGSVKINNADALVSINKYSVVLKSINAKEGLLDQISYAINKIDIFQKVKVKPRRLKSIINSINDLYDILNSITIDFNRINNMFSKIKLTGLQTFVKEVNDTINTSVDIVNPIKLKVKLLLLQISLKTLMNSILSLKKIAIEETQIDKINKNILILKKPIESAKHVLEIFNSIKVNKFPIIKFLLIRKSLNAIALICWKLASLILLLPIISLANITLRYINVTSSLLSSVFINLQNTPVGLKTLIKIFFIKTVLFEMIDLLRILNILSYKMLKYNTILDTGTIYFLVIAINEVFNSINTLKSGIKAYLKIKIASSVLFSMIKMFRILNILSNTIYKSNLLLDTLIILLVVKNVNKIFDEIVSTKSGILAKAHLNSIITSLKLLKLALRAIHSLRIKLRDVLKVLLIRVLFTELAKTFLIITLSSPVFLLGLLVMPIIMLSVWIFAKSISIISKTLIKAANIKAIIGMIAITIISIFLVALAGMFALISMLAVPIVKNSLFILGFLGVVTLSILLITGIGLLASLAIPVMIPAAIGLFAMIGVTTLVTILASMLLILQHIKLDGKAIQDNVDTIINTSKYIIARLFIKDKDEKDTKWRRFGRKRFALKAILFLIVTSLTVFTINLIAVQLRILQSLKLDSRAIVDNTNIVLNTASNLIESIMHRKDNSEENKSKKPWIEKLLSKKGSNIGGIISIIMNIAYLAITIAAVTLILLISAQLRILQTINLDHAQILFNTNTVILTAQTLIDSIFNKKDTVREGETNEKKKGLLKRLISGIGDGIEMIASIGWLSTALISVGLVSKLANHLNTINSLPDLSNVESKTVAICNAADKVINSITTPTNDAVATNNRLSVLERVTNMLNSISIDTADVDNAGKMLDNYVNFVDKVNSVEVNKLENATNMFKQMSRFSTSIKGDFDKLAESLSEKLLPVLEELKEVMNVIPEKIDVGFQSTSASIAATTAAPTKENVTAQVNRENPNLTADEVDKIVTTRMNEKATTDANGVAAKLDEMITLLKGFGSGYVTVKTI